MNEALRQNFLSTMMMMTKPTMATIVGQEDGEGKRGQESNNVAWQWGKRWQQQGEGKGKMVDDVIIDCSVQLPSSAPVIWQ
jgi:hypothetical protein